MERRQIALIAAARTVRALVTVLTRVVLRDSIALTRETRYTRVVRPLTAAGLIGIGIRAMAHLTGVLTRL